VNLNADRLIAATALPADMEARIAAAYLTPATAWTLAADPQVFGVTAYCNYLAHRTRRQPREKEPQ